MISQRRGPVRVVNAIMGKNGENFIMKNFLYVQCCIIIQIITELFPISSGGHVQLFERVVALFFDKKIGVDNREIVVPLVRCAHIPMAIIILFFYASWWLALLCNLTMCMSLSSWQAHFILSLFIACGITSLFFIATRYVSFPDWVVSVGFAMTALLLLSLVWCPTAEPYKIASITFYQATILGFAQGVALLPGLSRFAFVFVGARWLGFCPREAFAITWVLYLPLIIAAGFVGLWQLGLLSVIKKYGLTMMITGVIAYTLFCAVAWLALHNFLYVFTFYLIIPFTVSLFLYL